MKQVMLTTLVVVLFASCSKKDAVVAPPAEILTSLIKDSGYTDQTVASPKTKLVIGKMSYTAGVDNKGIKKIMPSFVLSGISLSSIKNFYCRITREGDSANAVFTLSPSAPVLDGTIINTDGKFASINNGKYTIWWYADINGVQTGNLYLKTSIEYLTSGIAKTIDFVRGQTITFATAKLATAVSATTPLSKNVQAGGERSTLDIDLTASGGWIDIVSAQVRIEDATVISDTKGYDGTSPIGFIAYSATGTVTKTIPLNLTIPDGQTATVSFKHLLKQITGASQSQTNIKTTLVSVTYKNQFGETKTNDTAREGNDIYVYRSLLVAESVPQSNLQLGNGVRRKMATLKLTPQGDGSLAQITYTLNFLNTFGNVYQSLDNLECWINGVNVTTMVIFSTKQYQYISSVSPQIMNPFMGDSLLYMKYVGGSGEYPISAIVTVEIYATPQNFWWGNAVEFGVAYDTPAPLIGSTYLVASAFNQNLMTLSSSRYTPGTTPAIIYSDKSAGPQHTAVPGGNSPDWFKIACGSQQTFYAN